MQQHLSLSLFPLSTGLTPKELFLNLDVAVYYFFLQLYSMFPVSLFGYLRGRYGPTGEVEEFQEYIVVSCGCCHVACFVW